MAMADKQYSGNSQAPEECLVSVIIPMYRAEKWIESAIESVEQQTWSNWELILVDDGSPDRCGGIGDTWARKDGRIRVVRHAENRGISAARNTGVREAKGDYAVFVDADDFAMPDYIGQMVRVAGEQQVPLVCCNHTVVRGEKKKTRFRVTEQAYRLSEEEAMRGVLFHDVPDASVWGKLIRRDLLSACRYPEGKLFEDTYCIADLIHAAGEIAFYPKPLYEYRIQSGSISHGRFSPAQMDFIDAVDHMTAAIDRYFPGRMAEGIARRKLHAYLSVRRLLASEKKEYQTEKNELRKQILAEAGRVSSAGKLAGRDRIAVTALRLGDRCFDTLWSLYERFR